MLDSKPVQYGMLGVVAIIASVKINDKCSYCAVALIAVSVLLFIAAVYLQVKKEKKSKKLKTNIDMAQKKQTLGSFDELGKLFGIEKEPQSSTQENNDTGLPQYKQTLELHFSKKGRAGKVATVISGITGNSGQIKALAKELKIKLGVGGSVKNGEIIIQGNLREKLARILREMGYQTKNIGG